MVFWLLILPSLLYSGNPVPDWARLQKKQPTLRHAQWGLHAVYVDDGTPLLELDADAALTPASVFKLLTTALALDKRGPDFRFETRLLYDGALTADGVLNGNLIIWGGGDPTWGSDRIPGNPGLDSLMRGLYNSVYAAGIHKIHGDIRVNISRFPEQRTPGNWNWMDIGNYYGAGAGALNIHDNLYHLWFRPGPIGRPARVLRTDPVLPDLIFENHMLTGARGSGDQGYIYAAPGSQQAVLRGSIPAGRDFSIKGALPDPARFAAQKLKETLIANGIAVSGGTGTSRQALPDNVRLLRRFHSPPLRTIIEVVHRRSFNLYAEATGKEAARAMGFPASDRGFARALKAFLKEKKIDTEGLRAYDACGLSPDNSVTPRLMTSLLRLAARSPWFGDFYNTLSIAGNDSSGGFFKRWGRGTPLENNARVKSGLINGVRSLAGYMSTSGGRLIAFCFIANRANASSHTIDSLHKKLLLRLWQATD
ncbi:MAG: D-alanyl-D-alanine carboxypeptidase/D-alanyl-D-alanine-endopeptidase [Calditrichaeota bacterium]|nr:MAG: D-alanyl-D-alanine carboxypeptidase/D-alanyl-D-alanine-endopeptidase [Calditrichota bacterium]